MTKDLPPSNFWSILVWWCSCFTISFCVLWLGTLVNPNKNKMKQHHKKALFSLNNKDKPGSEVFACELISRGWEIWASGGTFAHLKKEGLNVIDVASVSGLSPILDHRVVTLSPQVHGGLLAEDTAAHDADRAAHQIPWFGLVYCTFYDLRSATDKPDVTVEEVQEKTDIGGPTMSRSAAKTRRLVLIDSSQQKAALAFLDHEEEMTPDERRQVRHYFAGMAELEVGQYVRASAQFLLKHPDFAAGSEVLRNLGCSS